MTSFHRLPYSLRKGTTSRGDNREWGLYLYFAVLVVHVHITSDHVSGHVEIESRGAQRDIPCTVQFLYLSGTTLVKYLAHDWWKDWLIVGLYRDHEPAFYAKYHPNNFIVLKAIFLQYLHASGPSGLCSLQVARVRVLCTSCINPTSIFCISWVNSKSTSIDAPWHPPLNISEPHHLKSVEPKKVKLQSPRSSFSNYFVF